MKSLDTIWNNCLQYMRQHVNEQSFKTWFEPIKPVKIEANVLTIQVPSQFFYEWLEDRYVTLLRQAITQEMGEAGRLEYQIVVDRNAAGNVPYTINLPANNAGLGINNPPPKTPDNKTGNHPKNPFILPGIKDRILDSSLNPAYTFDTYVEGDANQLARSAGIAVAKNPGKTAFNPLVLYGDSGLGKTHLAQAIGNYVRQTYKDKAVYYISSDQFTNQFIDAVRNGSVTDFVNFFNLVDVLIVDDVQFFASKDKTQDIFFHTFNQLHQSGKQIVLTCDKPPSDLTGMEERLLSRFKWGLTADIKLPDFETRVAILEKKLYSNGVELSREIVEYIAHSVQTNIREMEGVVNSLIAQALLAKREIDLPLTESIVRSIIKIKNEQQGFTIESIQQITAEYFNIPIEAMIGSSRKREIVQSRQLAMYLIKKYMEIPLKSIGSAFGNRDHSTVIHACQVVADLSQTDVQFKKYVTELEKRIDKEGKKS
jgi:chromosomal replication initiator protein